MGVIALTNPYALKSGTLSIAADDFTSAVTQVEFSPSVSQSSVRTINGVVHREQSTSEWTVTVGFVQDLAAPGVPVIASVTPAGQSVGKQVLISGTGFASMVSGTIDGAAIVSYTVVDDRNLVATIPAGAVGASNVIITNSAGASAALSYTVV